MPNIRLTNANVKKIQPPESGRATYKDTKLNGFQLRVSETGTKTFCVRADLKGKTRRVTLGRFPNLSAEQAERLAKEELSQLAHGVDPTAYKRAEEARAITLSECLTDYIDSRSALKESTAEEYRRTLKQYLPDWMDRPLIEINRDKVERRHSRIGKKSPSRANKTMRILRAVFEYAHGKYEDENGEPVFLHNPVKRLSHAKAWYKETRRTSYIKGASIKPWFEAVNSAPDWLNCNNPEAIRDYLLLILFTGLRRNEAASLRWNDVDLHHGTLTISETKNSHPHTLPLTPFLVELFQRRKKATGKSPFVFPSSGKEGHLIDPKKAVAKVRKECGVYFTPHDLRRTFITTAESLGIRDYTLKRLLNHRSGGDVTDGYIITDVERLREPMQQITNRLLLLATQPANVVGFSTAKRA